MISRLVLLALSGAAAAELPDWFALRITSVDSSKVVAHDSRSGVAVSYDDDRNADQWLRRLRKSPRLIHRQSGKTGSFNWELLELADSSADAKALARDFGEAPSPGSWEAALLKAYSPPADCDRELRYFVRRSGQPPTVFKAAPCNAEQRARVQSLVDAFMAGSSPTEVLEKEAFGKTGVVSATDQSWFESAPSVAEVLARVGTPEDVWPRYPDGFSLLYGGTGSNSDGWVAIDFGQGRCVAQVRSLPPSAWAP